MKELEEAVALAAKATQGSGKPKTQPAEEVKGVCLHFQRNRCNRGSECNFRHVRLTPEQVKSLEAWVEQGKKNKSQQGGAGSSSSLRANRAIVTCYACGEAGHYSNACPNAAAASAGGSSRAFAASSGSNKSVGSGSAETQLAELIKRFGAKKVMELSLSLTCDQGKGAHSGEPQGKD